MNVDPAATGETAARVHPEDVAATHMIEGTTDSLATIAPEETDARDRERILVMTADQKRLEREDASSARRRDIAESTAPKTEAAEAAEMIADVSTEADATAQADRALLLATDREELRGTLFRDRPYTAATSAADPVHHLAETTEATKDAADRPATTERPCP